jgi:hypothetical protein
VVLDRWCREHLGSGVAVVRWFNEGTGVVWGVDLHDGRAVVVKAHRSGFVPDEHLVAFVEVQHRIAALHPWAPMPLAGPAPLGDRVATAETLLADGVPASDPQTMATALHALVGAAGGPPPGLFPMWSFSTLWPPPHQEHIDLHAPGGEWIDRIAADARTRLQAPSGTPVVVGHVDWRCEHVLVDRETAALRAVHDWDSLTAGPESWIAGAASACFTVDFHARDGSPARWPSPSESEAFIAAYDPAGRLDIGQARAAGDYHLAYIARCVHSVGGFPEVAHLLAERTSTGPSAR